jgi:hypothetical protein
VANPTRPTKVYLNPGEKDPVKQNSVIRQLVQIIASAYPSIFGGTAANSTLKLNSTSSTAPSSDAIIFYTGGVEAARFNSFNDLIIGNVDPSNAVFSVTTPHTTSVFSNPVGQIWTGLFFNGNNASTQSGIFVATTYNLSGSRVIEAGHLSTDAVTYTSYFIVDSLGRVRLQDNIAIPAGGATAQNLQFASQAAPGFGIYYGSSAPTVTAFRGSLYMRTDGTTTNNRAYVNTSTSTSGGTAWASLTASS